MTRARRVGEGKTRLDAKRRDTIREAAANMALKRRVAELEKELQAEKDRRVEHRQMNQSLNEQVQKLEAELERRTAWGNTQVRAADQRWLGAERDGMFARNKARAWKALAKRLRGAYDNERRRADYHQGAAEALRQKLADANAAIKGAVSLFGSVLKDDTAEHDQHPMTIKDIKGWLALPAVKSAPKPRTPADEPSRDS